MLAFPESSLSELEQQDDSSDEDDELDALELSEATPDCVLTSIRSAAALSSGLFSYKIKTK